MFFVTGDMIPIRQVLVTATITKDEQTKSVIIEYDGVALHISPIRFPVFEFESICHLCYEITDAYSSHVFIPEYEECLVCKQCDDILLRIYNATLNETWVSKMCGSVMNFALDDELRTRLESVADDKHAINYWLLGIHLENILACDICVMIGEYYWKSRALKTEFFAL